jgi:hypothetical protein
MSTLADLSTADAEELRRYYLFRPCETREELRQWLIAYIGLDLPDCIVDEDSNSSPLDMVWTCYSKMRANSDPDFNRALFYACRDGFKTLGAAAIEVLSILHLDRSVAHMAAITEQAQKAQSYVKKAFRRPYLRDFVVGDNERETKIIRFYNPKTQHSLTVDEYKKLTAEEKKQHEEISRTLAQYNEREEYIKIVVCTMQGANSEHVPLLVIDEVDVVSNPAAYAEAQNIPSGRGGILDLTILTSTRKQAFGLVQDEINRQHETGLHVFHWNILDITEACPPSRHKPELPKITLYRSRDTLKGIKPEVYESLTPKERETYQKDDNAFAGCGDCALFAVCKTRLATHQKSTSTFLNPIPLVINKFRRQKNIDMAKAQLMCWKPASTGLVYPRFDRTKHVLSPAQAYKRVFGVDHDLGNKLSKNEFLQAVRERDVQWYAAMDFGQKHNFAYTHGFKDGDVGYITNAFASPGLEVLEASAQLESFRVTDDPIVFPDVADLAACKIMKKEGWRIRQWKKGAGSVVAGIGCVQAKLSPVMADYPELFFVHDIDEDPGMALLIQRFQEYHWVMDAAGRPTNVPDDTDDDECDSLRYWVMNVFPMKSGGLSAGQGVGPKKKKSDKDDAQNEDERSGKRGRLIWDLG